MGKTSFEVSRGRRQLMAFYFRLRYICCVPQGKKSDFDPPKKTKENSNAHNFRNTWRETLVECSIDWKFNADFKNGIKRDKISSRYWVMTLFVDSNHDKFSKVMFPDSDLKIIKKARENKNPQNQFYFEGLTFLRHIIDFSILRVSFSPDSSGLKDPRKTRIRGLKV